MPTWRNSRKRANWKSARATAARPRRLTLPVWPACCSIACIKPAANHDRLLSVQQLAEKRPCKSAVPNTIERGGRGGWGPTTPVPPPPRRCP